MYLLIVCAVSWLVLLGSLITAWTGLPHPRTPTDVVVIVIMAAATAAFARLGLVALIALLLRMLPNGRVRSLLASFVVRAMPRLLASSALTVVSASIAVQAGHAAPAQQDRAGPVPHPVGAETVAEAPVDPGWPTVSDPPPESPETETSEPEARESETPEDQPSETEPASGPQLRDPGWPTSPPDRSTPEESSSPSPEADAPDDDGGSTSDSSEPEPSPEVPEPAPRTHEPTIHDVEPGESLWSIAETLVDDPDEIPELVADIHSANKHTIGPDPSLILAGQRLEIRP